jgi:hypothetical protein
MIMPRMLMEVRRGRHDEEKGTYMNPITAVTLMMEKTNSASPYPRTPKRLMEMMTRRKMVTQAAPLTSLAPGQYETVMEAATISRGRVTSHERA